MSNHQKEIKLNTSVAELVRPLLKRLKSAKEQVPENSEMENIIDQISTEVVKAKNILDSRENWDRELTGYFGKIERQIDSWIDHNYRMTEWNEHTVTDLKDILNQLSWNQRANPSKAGTKPREKAYDLPQKTTITDVGESSTRSNQDNEISMVLKCMNSLDPQLRNCLNSLAIFPENTELEKRLVIYWWIGLGLVSSRSRGQRRRTIEQVGEIFFSDLMNTGILIPVRSREHNQVIDRCTIKPAIHKHLIFGFEEKGIISSEKTEEGTWHLYEDGLLKGLLNLDQRYLNSKDISSRHDLRVVHLGSWRYTEIEVYNRVEETGSEETKSKDHIEVDKIDFLKKLGEKVTYLSLRGISRIEELHESIGKLKHLMILDLRSCHNLEKLLRKPRSTLKQKLFRWILPQESWFKKLMVLDISECYLLDHMPKWISELSNLEVLKGFVVGSMENKNQCCRLGDLSNLRKLRKLSIRIVIDIFGTEDFNGLKGLYRLSKLTITWGENKSNSTIPTYSLPENLEKLDIRCYPRAEARELLNPTKLKYLKKLYIRGGNLTKIPCNDNWEVEILRLRFLKKLVYPIDWKKLRHSFKNLKYVEYMECPRPKNFPKDGNSWSKEKDEPFQSGNDTSNQS